MGTGARASQESLADILCDQGWDLAEKHLHACFALLKWEVRNLSESSDPLKQGWEQPWDIAWAVSCPKIGSALLNTFHTGACLLLLNFFF